MRYEFFFAFCGVCFADDNITATVSVVVPGWLEDATHLENITSFESNCPAVDEEYSEAALQKIAVLREDYATRNAHTGHLSLLSQDEHNEVPWNIIVIFTIFGIGAVVRHLFAEPPLCYFPYTVVMFSIGMVWGQLGRVFDSEKYTQLAHMNPHLILYTFLPLLIFESAFAMEMSVFKKLIGQCLLLAGPGLVIASGLTAVGARYMFVEYNWDWSAALLFGVTLSATDPVAVVAILKELGVPKGIGTLIEGESLLNDGTAIVFFEFLREAVKTENCIPEWESCTDQCVCPAYHCPFPYTPVEVFKQFSYVVVGGMLVGLVMGIIMVYSLNNVFSDALIEITVTICTSYLTFFISEGWFEVSGVLALVVLGCFTAKYRTSISPDVMPTLHHFWEMVAYLANTLIFTLAGMLVSQKAFDNFRAVEVIYLSGMYVLVNLIRAFILLLATPSLLCFSKDLNWSPGNFALVTWGGLRGAIGLTLSLVLESDDGIIANVRDKIMFQVAGIVVGTMVINGITTRNVVRYFKLDKVEERRKRIMKDRFAKLLIEQEQNLQDVGANPAFYDTNWERLQKYTSLTSDLKDDYSDLYNKRNASFSILNDGKADGRTTYFNLITLGIKKQERKGMLGRKGIRLLRLLVESMRDAPEGGLMDASDVTPLCKMPWLWRIMIVFPFWRKAMQKRARGHAFDINLACAECHLNARRVLERHDDIHKDVRDQIRTHCRKTAADCIARCNAITLEHQEVSCAIKTKHAAREVLNYMDNAIASMLREGRLDEEDARLLQSAVVARKADIQKNFPFGLADLSSKEILEASQMYKDAEEECQQKLLAALKRGAICVKEFGSEGMPVGRDADGGVQASPLFASASKQASLLSSPRFSFALSSPRSSSSVSPSFSATMSKHLNGIFIVISGIVKLRVGKAWYHHGEGYVIGLQDVLTHTTRFNDVTTESPCQLLFLPADLLADLSRVHPSFTLGLYRQAGINAAKCLLPLCREDQRVTDNAYDNGVLSRQFVEQGQVEYLQDPEEFRGDAQMRMKFDHASIYLLLQGRCWEYEINGVRQGEHHAPAVLPKVRFATFTGHAVLFCMPVTTTAAQRAQQLWRHLRSRSRSVQIWSSLRGPLYARVALPLLLQAPFQRTDDYSLLNEGEQEMYQVRRAQSFVDTQPRRVERGARGLSPGFSPAVSPSYGESEGGRTQRSGVSVSPGFPQMGEREGRAGQVLSPMLSPMLQQVGGDVALPLSPPGGSGGGVRQGSYPGSVLSPASADADTLKAFTDMRTELQKGIEKVSKDMLGGLSSLRSEMSILKEEYGSARRPMNNVSFSIPGEGHSPSSLGSMRSRSQSPQRRAEPPPAPASLAEVLSESAATSSPMLSPEVRADVPRADLSVDQLAVQRKWTLPQGASPHNERNSIELELSQLECVSGYEGSIAPQPDRKQKNPPVRPIAVRPGVNQQEERKVEKTLQPAFGMGLTPSASSASGESFPRGIIGGGGIPKGNNAMLEREQSMGVLPLGGDPPVVDIPREVKGEVGEGADALSAVEGLLAASRRVQQVMPDVLGEMQEAVGRVGAETEEAEKKEKKAKKEKKEKKEKKDKKDKKEKKRQDNLLGAPSGYAGDAEKSVQEKCDEYLTSLDGPVGEGGGRDRNASPVASGRSGSQQASPSPPTVGAAPLIPLGGPLTHTLQEDHTAPDTTPAPNLHGARKVHDTLLL